MVERLSIIVVTIGIIGLGYIGYQYFVDTDEPEEITVSEIVEAPEAPEAITLEQVAERNSADNCWVVIDSVIYDLTDFTAEHPGGETNVINMCGADASDVFATEAGPHNEGNLQRLEQYVVGELE